METDELQRVVPFQLQFDKPIPSQVKIAEWNPEKDLLAMVTEDSKIVVHRFNWQRLWTISPGRCITSLCWRPDGKAIAIGLEDGTISLHDVENGKLLRSLKSHTVAVLCLNWEEDQRTHRDDLGSSTVFDDRTSRFFPPAPRAPQMPGLVSGDSSFMDDGEDSLGELSKSSHQCFNVLCSGDKDGNICLSIFGIFPVGKINIHKLRVPVPSLNTQTSYKLLNASISKVALSKDLCCLIVMCSGKLKENGVESIDQEGSCGLHGLHCLVLDTSIFWKRKNELHQVARQASNIGDMIEVIQSSVSVMTKQWSDAMKTFHEKFSSLSTLIIDHGIDSTPQEEFLSLLGGSRISPAVHQFLVNSIGEVGVKRVSKVVCGTGKELQLIVLNHLQPAAEIIGFRMGELRGLSKWRARYQVIGLDEKLVNEATERSGMLLVQVERFMRVLSSVLLQFSNFFNWLLKCIKLLMQEPSDQHLSYNSEHVIIFLKFLYDQDPVRQLLELSEYDSGIEVDFETMRRVRELVQFGGFSDCNHLQRTLAKEFQQLETSFKEALQMPFLTISQKILCGDLLPLFPLKPSTICRSVAAPMSVSFYKDESTTNTFGQSCRNGYTDYISFQMLEEAFSDIANCIVVARGFMQNSSNLKKGHTSLEALLLSVPDGYECVALSLYKESELVLLLNETSTSHESSGEACMMIVQACDLPFVSLSRSDSLNCWELVQLKDSVVKLQLESEKVRRIPHTVIAPLAVSASRGLACVFAARKRALVYILEEDEEEEEEEEASDGE